MKILIINKDLKLGGGTTAIHNLEHGLRKFGIYIDIAIFENNIDLISINKNRVIILSKQKKIVKMLRPLYSFVFLFKLMFIVPKYDLIFTFERYPAYFNVILSKLFNKKSVIYVINPLLLSLKSIYKNRLLLKFHIYFHKIAFFLTDLVVALEKNAKKELVDYWLVSNFKIFIVPLFIDFNEIKILSKSKLNSQEKEIFSKNKVIINIGRLHSQKNQALLIRAFYLVRKKFKNVVLLIIGTGEEKNALRKLIKKLKLQDYVFIVENEINPFKYLALSDVFVLSSRFEGFGIVLLEALCSGLPIVSTDCSYGIRSILTPELPLTFKIHDRYMNNYGIIVLNGNQRTVKLMADNICYYLGCETNNKIKIKKMERALEFSNEKILPMWLKVIKK